MLVSWLLKLFTNFALLKLVFAEAAQLSILKAKLVLFNLREESG